MRAHSAAAGGLDRRRVDGQRLATVAARTWRALDHGR